MARDFVKVRDREFEVQLAQFLANLGPDQNRPWAARRLGSATE